MNRAAEQSAPAAKQIFLDAIAGMSFDDAKTIPQRGQHRRPRVLQGKDDGQACDGFKPIVERNLGEVGVTRQYEALMAQLNVIPLARAQTFDIDRYVINKALDGLFHVVSEQEKLIPTNPAARTTALLQEVFAKK